MAAAGMAVLVGATGVACSSTKSSTTATTAAGGSKIPTSAFSDHTGITATSVQLGNISTLDLGLFKGAAFGTDDRSFELRAERRQNGKGRIYTVTYQATDASGNSSTATATVTVPAPKGKYY